MRKAMFVEIDKYLKVQNIAMIIGVIVLVPILLKMA